MSLSLDLFYSYRSPYSYLATGRVMALAGQYDLEVKVRPVYPIAIRAPEFFDRVNPMWPPYLRRDTRRVAEMLGIPFRWPRPDPVVMSLEDGKRDIPRQQPYIHRLTRLGTRAAELGHGLAFTDEVSRLIWTGDVDGWDQGDHLAGAAARAGLDLAELDATVAAEPERLDGLIEDNQKALDAAGHWGVPTFVFEGEPFFGQDRLDMCVWRMKQKGLMPRAGAAE